MHRGIPSGFEAKEEQSMGEKKTFVVPIQTPEDEAVEGKDLRSPENGDGDEPGAAEDDFDATAEDLDPEDIPDLEAEEAAAEREFEHLRKEAEARAESKAEKEFERKRLKKEAEEAAECSFEVARLEEELKKAQEVRARALADYQNLEKRMVREVQRRVIEARSGLFTDLLPIIDTFDRAIQAEEQRDEGPDAEELRLLRGQLLNAMAKHGVTPMETAGQLFDPKLHEALGMVPGTDTPSQHIIEEVRRGFMVGETLLRAAQVIVAA